MSVLSVDRPDSPEPHADPGSDAAPASAAPSAARPDLAASSGPASGSTTVASIVWHPSDAVGDPAAALVERDALLRGILEAAGDAIFVKDAEGRYVAVSGVVTRNFGRPLGEVLGRTDADLQPAATAVALRAFDERVWRTGLMEEREEVLLCDGEPRLFWTRKSVLHDERGTPVGLLGVARDVTDRRRAADANAHLAAIVASSDDAIISKALDGTILTWNAGAERLFGWTSTEAIGLPITLIIPPELYSEEAGIIARIRAGERIDHYQTTRMRKDGQRVTVSLSVSPIRDAAGRVIMASKILRDITHEQEIGAERERLLGAERAARVEAERMQAQLQEQAFQLESQAVELEATIDELRETNEALRAEREVAERARAETERATHLLDAVVDQLPVGLYVAEAPSGRLVLHNRKADELLGHPPIVVDDVAGYSRYGTEHLDGTPYGPGEHALARALTDAEVVDQLELRYRRPDGTVVDLSVSAAPVRDVDGRVVMAVSTFLDVTARRSAERDLAEREALLRGFFSAPGVMMLVMDETIATDGTTEHRIVLSNAEAAALFRLTPAEIAGRTMESLGVPAARRQISADLFAKVRERGIPVTLELPSLRPGRWVRMIASEIAAVAPGVNRYALMLVDMTEEHDATAQRRRLQLLVEHSTDLIVVATPDLLVEFVNPAGLALIGAASVEELQGVSALELVHDEAQWQIETEVLPALQAQGHWAGETALRHLRTSAAVPVEMTAFAIADPTTNETIALASVSRPIGERKRLQAELLQSQKMEVVGRLAGGVAHDFNNLLTVIRTSADFLLADLPRDAPQHDDVWAIADAAERSATLTRQLLAFSRRQVVQPRPFDVNELAGRADRMLRRLVGEDVTMTLSLGAELPLVLADPGQVEQALVNLVVNARDAMPAGGTLTIATGTTELDDAYVADHPAAHPGRYVTLSVTDTGTGMDHTTMARLFEPFFTTKEIGKGTGLGLSTVRAIVDQARGTVVVYSEPGVGSTFKLCLPVAHEPGGTAPAVAPAMPRGTETVLLVDDDAPVRRAARRALAAQGYTVLEAASHDEALALARTHHGRIHLVLVDVVLPGPGGRVIADDVRGLHPDAAVVFMSGYTADAVVRHRIDAGAPFVEKPFTVGSLAIRIREALDAARDAAIDAARAARRGDR